ncbi:T9SS type A sorting domain-containing protein [Fulvivirga sp. M361]|uniref:M4 family metallopeptidase n=1 Tax=Fulvivirga sp. M361 TaxID=2594266 RepID=UPI001179F104|nr:M4 family metallopeptidase [Fulvivirga sp. M361]TRX53695.1 T9SS type A sorting domain-containing protein [Fulvivirga sp. M361]
MNRFVYPLLILVFVVRSYGQTIDIPASYLYQVYKQVHLSSADSLSVVNLKQDKLGMIHVRLQQYHHGVKVLGGEVIAHFDNNRLKSIQDHSVQTIKMNEGHAARLGKISQPDKNHYLIKEDNDFYLTECTSESGLLNFVDAVDGHTTLTVPQYRGVNSPGKAITRYHGEVDITAYKQAGGFILQEERQGVLIRTLNAENQTIEQFTENFGQAPLLDTVTNFQDEDNLWDLRNERLDEIATDIHWASEVTFDYFLDVHKRNSIDNEGGDINSIVHLGDDWDEAFYLAPPFNFMGYGDGGPLGPNATLDVVAHEMAHAVVFYSAQLLYIGETASLDEAFADIFGTSVKFYRSVNGLKDLWVLAEQLGGFRDLSDPKAKGQPDTYKGENWYSGQERDIFAHQNNGPINYWFYLLTMGGEGINDNGDDYNISALGLGKAEQIAYRTLNYYLNSTAKFMDARSGSIQATTDLFGKDSQELRQVIKAWDAVGIRKQVITNVDETSLSRTASRAFPNPVQDGERVQIDIEDVPAQGNDPDITIYSTLGSKVNTKGRIQSGGQGVISLDLTGLPAGIYILRRNNQITDPIKIYKR